MGASDDSPSVHMDQSTPDHLADRDWYILGRWQEYEGEEKANLLRMAAVGAFYIVQLINFYVFDEAAEESLAFHRNVTILAVAWSLVALGVLLCLRNRIFPAALKYVSTGFDICLTFHHRIARRN